MEALHQGYTKKEVNTVKNEKATPLLASLLIFLVASPQFLAASTQRIQTHARAEDNEKVFLAVVAVVIIGLGLGANVLTPEG